MKTMTPAQAEHQLTRRSRRALTNGVRHGPHALGPIPQHLWEQAIAFTTVFSITRVAQAIRVSGGELKKRCAAHSPMLLRSPPPPWALWKCPPHPVWPRPHLGDGD